MFYHLFVDSTNCSGFRKYSCAFRKFACFSSDFERYNDLGICLWNRKQHRRSKKSDNVAGSATNLILACSRFRLQCRECTVWPRNVGAIFFLPRWRHTNDRKKLYCSFCYRDGDGGTLATKVATSLP